MNEKKNEKKNENNKYITNKSKIENLQKNLEQYKLLIIVLIMTCFMLFIFATQVSSSKEKEIKELNSTINEEQKEVNEIKEENRKLLEKLEKYNKKISVQSDNIATQIPIITFHRTVDSESKEKYFKDDEWINDLSVTESELKYLYDNDWKTIDLDEFYCWYNKDCDFPVKTFVITIDDGDSEAYFNILPILEKYNFNATLFSIGKAIPEKTEDLEEPTRKKLGYDKIKELRENNSLLQVESHSYDLHHLEGKKEAALTKTYNELLQDFKNNEKYEFKFMAYPYGVYNKKVIKAVANSSIKMAFKFKNGTYATRYDNKYEISRIKVNSYMTLEEFKKIFSYAK